MLRSLNDLRAESYDSNFEHSHVALVVESKAEVLRILRMRHHFDSVFAGQEVAVHANGYAVIAAEGERR